MPWTYGRCGYSGALVVAALASAYAMVAAAGCAGDSFTANGGGDGAVEGAAGDGASGDAMGGGGDGASAFCATQSPPPRVCIDFDEPTRTAFVDGHPTALAPFKVVDGGSAAIVASDRSPPGAMEVTSPDTHGSSGSIWVGIDRPLAASAQPGAPHAHLRFDYRLASGTTLSERRVADLILRDTTYSDVMTTFYVQVNGGGTPIAGLDVSGWEPDGSSNFKKVDMTLPPFDQWVTVDLDLSVIDSQAIATASYNGSPTPAGSVTTLLVVPSTAIQATFFIGLNANPDELPATADIDNIVLTTP